MALGVIACVFLVAFLVSQGLGRASLWAGVLGLPVGVLSAGAGIWAAARQDDRLRLSDPSRDRNPDTSLRNDLSRVVEPDSSNAGPSIVRGQALVRPLPELWNVPARNPAFVGRGKLLRTLHKRLASAGPLDAQVLHGIAGVGKTQLAAEYAHRFADDYTLIWWVAAEREELIDEQFAALAVDAEWVASDADIATAVKVAMAKLRQRAHWLLVFDNADDPAGLRSWFPGGPGHVIITSRNPDWRQVAVPVAVEEFTRAESTTLLRGHIPAMSRGDADRLADALGDLPLALAQAAGAISETGMSPPEYQSMLGQEAGLILAEGVPPTYPAALTAAVRVSINRLSGHDPAAVPLLELCALLAPEPIPISLFTRDLHALPQPSGETAITAIAFRRTLGLISRYGLARMSTKGLQLHRLTQAILRATSDVSTRDHTRRLAEAIVVAARPDDGRDPQYWSAWAALMPHILALAPETASSTQFRNLSLDMVWFLISRGDIRAGHDLAERFYRAWISQLGPGELDTLRAARHLASAYRRSGDYAQARDLDADALQRLRQVLGSDHALTLKAANNLAIDLRLTGDLAGAKVLNEDTLSRRRRVLGEDDPETLRTATNLATDLQELGHLTEAQVLGQDTLARMRRIQGDSSPDALRMACNFGIVLRELGRVAEACVLHEDTLDRFRRSLGHDDIDTLETASQLAIDLRELGRLAEARNLDQDTLSRMRLVLGDHHPDTSKTAARLALDLHTAGSPQELDGNQA